MTPVSSALPLLLLAFATLSAHLTRVLGSNSECQGPLGPGTAAPGDPYWLQNIKHQGLSAFNYNASAYQIFRNVQDFGAKGDGVTDDTVAINLAVSTGNRCGPYCGSSSLTPATVYFPPGTYLISAPILAYYYTEIIGDARTLPTILASPNFTGLALIDADPYILNGGGAQWYVNQNNFFRSVKNFVIDTTQMAPTSGATAIHWQVSQATSLYNIDFRLSTVSGNTHRGIFMESGSGGFMGDLVINGGNFGLNVGNQQFTVRNLTVNNAHTAVSFLWNWEWAFQDIKINNCQVGFDVITGTVEAVAIMDAVVTNTPIFFRSSSAVTHLNGSIVLNNIQLDNVDTAVGIVNGTAVLPGFPGGTMTIDTWVQGNVYMGQNPHPTYTANFVSPVPKSWSLLDSSGRVYGRGRPSYADYALSQIVSVKDYGAKGDGYTDDTEALQAVLDNYANCKIIFFDAGTYIVTSTLKIPAGTRIFGEAWAVIMGSGPTFEDMKKPSVVVQVGNPGDHESDNTEFGGIIFSTRGPAPGAIVVEWNVNPSQQGGAGMWDSYIRLAGTLGTDLQLSQCPKTNPGPNCYAAFLGLHLTAHSSAYIEGLWVWLADHDWETYAGTQITVYSGRGILSESNGPVWGFGTASEHHVIYQYNFANADNHFFALPQTETPYYQPTPAPPTPFTSLVQYHDPSFRNEMSAWALVVTRSSNIVIFGAGFYSFFQNYTQGCLTNTTCQQQIVDIDITSSVHIYSMGTVGTTYEVSVDNNGIVPFSSNLNGFAQTVTLWSTYF